MPRYFFHLKDGGYGYFDTSGVVLPNDAAAIDHCRLIATELLKGREAKTRHWRVSVHNVEGTRIHETRLVDEDKTFRHLAPALQKRVELLCRRCHAVQDAVEASQRAQRRSKALVARSRRKPYLVFDENDRY